VSAIIQLKALIVGAPEELRAELDRLVAAVAPWLLKLPGVGPDQRRPGAGELVARRAAALRGRLCCARWRQPDPGVLRTGDQASAEPLWRPPAQSRPAHDRAGPRLPDDPTTRADAAPAPSRGQERPRQRTARSASAHHARQPQRRHRRPLGVRSQSTPRPCAPSIRYKPSGPSSSQPVGGRSAARKMTPRSPSVSRSSPCRRQGRSPAASNQPSPAGASCCLFPAGLLDRDGVGGHGPRPQLLDHNPDVHDRDDDILLVQDPAPAGRSDAPDGHGVRRATSSPMLS